MTVRLRRPTGEEYAVWSVASFAAYVDELVASGSMSRPAAEEKARREDVELLPQGLDTPRQLIYRVEADGAAVGWLWFALDKPGNAESGVGYIYDIGIDEAFRGRGFGRAAMQLAEEEARSHGLHALALNVFGTNTVARRLYASLGYSETSVKMRKEL